MNQKYGIIYLHIFALCLNILLSCDSKKKKISEEYIISNSYKEVEYSIVSSIVFEEDSIPFSNDFYSYENTVDGDVVFFDKTGCRIMKFNDEGELLNAIDKETYFEANTCPTSYKRIEEKDYLLFFHQLRILIDSANKVRVVNLTPEPSKLIATDIFPLEILTNGSLLIATGVNVLNEYEYYSRLLDKNLTEVMNEQYLFSLYSSEGNMINQFGRFPDTNYVESGNIYNNHHYFYAAKKDTIYVAFPFGNKIYSFSNRGEPLDTVDITLPIIDYETKEKYKANDNLAGFGVDQSSDSSIFYFHYIHYVTPHKVENLLFKYNAEKGNVSYSSIVNGNNYMLPVVRNDTVSFIKRYYGKEDKELINLVLDE